MPNERHLKGDRAEIIAAEYFMKLGFLVLRNMGSHGTVDLILVDEDGDGAITLIDVKAISLRSKNGYKVNRIVSKKQKKLNVKLIYVNLDTKEVLTKMPRKRDKRLDIN
tara:strand:+ start:211 stop:537 length:327 start_codon:yes stop_codon:yes gene_type:complete